MWITIDQLLCLKAIKEAGSINGASERLHRAKSAIHYSIKKLEGEVGFEVLNTKKYRGVLTKKGEQLLAKSNDVLKSYDSLKESCHRIATGSEINLAVSATALYSLKKFNKAILKVQQKFPNTEIVFHRELLSGQKMLRERIVDVAIFEGTKSSDLIHKVQIDTVYMTLVISSGHPFLSLPVEDQVIENLLCYPQVIQRSTFPDADSYGIVKNSKRWTVSDLAAKKEIIVDGLGWGKLPAHDIQKEIKQRKLVVLDHIEKTVELPIYIGRLKGTDPGKAQIELWSALGA